MCVQQRGVGGPDDSGTTLFARAQGGCAESLNQLMCKHEGLVQAVVRRQVLAELSFAEALQAGRIGLWHAVMGYDPSRGLAFSTYAWPAIMREVWRAVKLRRCEQRQAPLVRATPEVGDPLAAVADAAIYQALSLLVQGLPVRLRYVIVARYGLAAAPSALYREIGAVLGVSGERARQLHDEALVRLRHPAYSQMLRSLLGRHTLVDYETADTQAQRWLRQRGGRHVG